MKLATLKNGSRDGQLVVVSKDLQSYVTVEHIVGTLQEALDDWDRISLSLQDIYEDLNHKKLSKVNEFDPKACMAPLPRAYQWADGSAYVNHVELVRRARGATLPEQFWTEPLLYQGGSDSFVGPCDDILLAEEEWGIDFEAEIAVITDDVPMGQKKGNILPHIKLIMLANDVSLRHLIPEELHKGFGFFQSKPSCAFSPVAVTPDELETEWENGRLNRPLHVYYNQELFGCTEAAEDMIFTFEDLIAHAAKTRHLTAGTIIGSGTVSNKFTTSDGEILPGRPVGAGGRGYSCLAEIRMIEMITYGKTLTNFMQFGDQVRIEMLDAKGDSIFGAIDQKLTQYK